MPKLVDLGEGISLNADHVVSVTRDFYGDHLLVRDVLGNTHTVRRQYGESIYDAEKRVRGTLSGSAS